MPENGPIPAHLLGNIWAQDWSNLTDLVAPGNADAGYSLTSILEQRKTSPIDMVKMGERFYTSLGFAPLPQDVLGAVALREAGRSRRRLPRERLGHRRGGRPAHQDVH